MNLSINRIKIIKLKFMGSDICICHYAFGSENESNIMSKNNEKELKNSKDITEKPFFNIVRMPGLPATGSCA